MTLLGPDVASFQAGIDLAEIDDAGFFTIKCTEGAGYVDPYYAAWLVQAKATGKPTWWYHFLTVNDSALSQAANAAAHVGDKSVAGEVDIEVENGKCPTFAQLLAFIDACHLDGLTIRIVYLPPWVWRDLWGSPDLTPLRQRGIVLISSNYPNTSVASGPAEYEQAGGDSGPGWAGYGGMQPEFWQFTDHAAEGGQRIDYSAFRGSTEELFALLGEAAPPVTSQTSSTSVVYTNMRLGSGGRDVYAIQTLLTALGFDTQGIDGQFGLHTLAAVQHAQKAWGIAQDGIVGKDTRAQMLAHLGRITYPGVLLVKGSTGSNVRLLQAMLWLHGYDPHGIDGVFGDATLASVYAFQTAAGIARDGKVGKDTWGHLT